ncbi:MAG: hypothetical protein FWD78_16940 [Treponema sp.]|nr:hypothetical protein [Treponema sp.]
MLTLERVRLVNWHNFKDTVIEIGNRCLLAGDNGSGKSTVIDAIQYVMAANLRMARFNSAAEERRGGGRDLMGYVRCKLGSESTEYRRDDTVAHVMLQWRNVTEVKGGGGVTSDQGFACGVCIEAYRDNHYNEHFWIGPNRYDGPARYDGPNRYDGSSANVNTAQKANITPGVKKAAESAIPSIKDIRVNGEKGEPLTFRQFKNILEENNIYDHPTKKDYIRDLTNRLKVFRRQPEINPYLDSLTRSIGFKPLDSIDQFVCDFILDENPVSIQDMKQNLENYKEAERQAKMAVRKIGMLKNICAKAAEWRNYDGLIIKQGYLKLRIELENEKQKKDNALRLLAETQNKLDFINREIDSLGRKRMDAEQELRALDQTLASNDAHRLFGEIQARIQRLENEIAIEEKKAEKYNELKSQCEALLNRKLFTGEQVPDFDNEIEKISEEAKKYRDQAYEAGRKKNEAAEQLRDIRSELADLERGILRYPDAPRELRSALEKAGVEAHFLAEAADITEPAWADAVEGWLNTRRFALLVDPAVFQKAIEVYNKLPRSVAGAFIPNIEKMRSAAARQGSLAETVRAEGYARIYIDFSLGRVMRTDLSNLKTYDSAVTKECMTYTNHTASRIREDIYKRKYLGRAALQERKKFLVSEAERIEAEFISAEKLERESRGFEECCNRAIIGIAEMKPLFPSIADSALLKEQRVLAEEELAAVDTQSFRELENKRTQLAAALKLIVEDNEKLVERRGSLSNKLSGCGADLETYTRSQEEKEDAIKIFGTDNPYMIGECEDYAVKRFSEASIADLTDTYESTLRNFRTHAETNKKDYGRLIADYEHEFHFLLGMEPADNSQAENLLKRLETSELPEYREKITKAYNDAEKEFRTDFISKLNERIEEARESFREINDILEGLYFGHDQYRFFLEELSERKGQIEMIRLAAKIPPSMEEGGLFTQLEEPAERKAAEELFNRILDSPLDSKELRDICDYRTYFHYDIIITETDLLDDKGSPTKSFLSKVLKEKSGGESQTPYYVAIAASFYRFYKAQPEDAVRLVIFDEAFNRMDDERIGKILAFYQDLNLQILTSVPPEKIDAIAPWMDRINVISRFGSDVKVRDCRTDLTDIDDLDIGMGTE